MKLILLSLFTRKNVNKFDKKIKNNLAINGLIFENILYVLLPQLESVFLINRQRYQEESFLTAEKSVFLLNGNCFDKLSL